jgi:CRP/FNR family transcriptional regulator
MGTGDDHAISSSSGATRDAPVRHAIGASNLAALDPAVVDELVRDAVRLRVPAGSVYRAEGDPGPHLELLLEGLVRVFVSAEDGRTLTVRYCRPGALIGVVSLFRPGYEMPGGLQALVDSEVLALRAAAVRDLAGSDPAVAGAMLGELAERVHAFVREFPGSAFGTVRQRLARHLLDLASEQQHDARLVAAVSHQELAAAVGTVREVVVRTLAELRREGLVETGRGGIRILDPDPLAAEAFATGVTQVPSRGDEGR